MYGSIHRQNSQKSHYGSRDSGRLPWALLLSSCMFFSSPGNMCNVDATNLNFVLVYESTTGTPSWSPMLVFVYVAVMCLRSHGSTTGLSPGPKESQSRAAIGVDCLRLRALFIWLIIRLIQFVFFSVGIVFFSHKKSANNVFQPAYN
jgi:uncharacterized membrane protein YhdT